MVSNWTTEFLGPSSRRFHDQHGSWEQWSFTCDTVGRTLDVTYPDGHERQQL